MKMSLNLDTTQMKANLQNIVTPLNRGLQLVLWCLSSERHFRALIVGVSIIVVLWCLSSKGHFSDYTVKSSRNPVTQKMANLQNTVTRL